MNLHHLTLSFTQGFKRSCGWTDCQYPGWATSGRSTLVFLGNWFLVADTRKLVEKQARSQSDVIFGVVGYDFGFEAFVMFIWIPTMPAARSTHWKWTSFIHAAFSSQETGFQCISLSCLLSGVAKWLAHPSERWRLIGDQAATTSQHHLEDFSEMWMLKAIQKRIDADV